MTTWTTIPDTQIDQDSPVTEVLMEALRNNPIAIAEGSTGAAINQALWHPYDAIHVGDTNDGIFWTGGIDAAATSIPSPTLTDGYDYALRLVGFANSGGSNSVQVEAHLATSATWETMFTGTTGVTAAGAITGFVALYGPRLTMNAWAGYAEHALRGANNLAIYDGASTLVTTATAQKIDGLQMSGGVNNWDTGTVALYRRRNIFAEW